MNNVSACVALSSATVLAFTASARTLVWTGAQGANWDLTTENWYDASDANKTPTAFQSGDNVIFDDTASGTTVKIISNKDAKPTYGTITFSNTVDYVWNADIDNYTTTYFTKSGTIDKWGSGQLTINFRNDFAVSPSSNTEANISISFVLISYQGELRTRRRSVRRRRT